MRNAVQQIAIAGLFASTSALAHAAGWNESVDGDLSNDRLSPSELSLALGLNPVSGAFGQGDLDYLAVTVPQGMQLSALRYGEGLAIGGVRSFIGVQAGEQMTVPPDTESAAALLGWSHFQDAVPGTDLLPDVGQGYGAIGFVGPLPAGAYTFWIQDTSSQPNLVFAFDFEVTPIPEPSAYALIGLGLGMVGFALKRPARKGRLG